MDKLEQFYEVIRKSLTMTLATAVEGCVTMRVVSPVYFQGRILFFTASHSQKYGQLRANPHGCVAVGPFFAEVSAMFCGATMRSDNQAYREAYSEKFPDAFGENVAFGGCDSEFILLTPTRLTGWTYENNPPSANEIPTIPFEILLE